MTNFFAMLLYLVFTSYYATAQMVQLITEEGLKISYKWEIGNGGEQLLLIEATNSNELALDFELSLFMKKGDKVVESTGMLSLCVGAGKTLKPKTSGLVFDVKTPRGEIDNIFLGAMNIVKADRKNCHL